MLHVNKPPVEGSYKNKFKNIQDIFFVKDGYIPLNLKSPPSTIFKV